MQSFGLLGDTLEGANASRRIICTVEQIVPRADRRVPTARSSRDFAFLLSVSCHGAPIPPTSTESTDGTTRPMSPGQALAIGERAGYLDRDGRFGDAPFADDCGNGRWSSRGARAPWTGRATTNLVSERRRRVREPGRAQDPGQPGTSRRNRRAIACRHGSQALPCTKAILVYEWGAVDRAHRFRPVDEQFIGALADRATATTCPRRLRDAATRRVRSGPAVGGPSRPLRADFSSTVLGPDQNPRRCGRSSGRRPRIAALAEDVIETTPHDPRRFVERVDFVTSPGLLPGNGRKPGRARRGGGPRTPLTPRAAISFEAGELTLDALAPGFSHEQALEGFSLGGSLSPDLCFTCSNRFGALAETSLWDELDSADGVGESWASRPAASSSAAPSHLSSPGGHARRTPRARDRGARDPRGKRSWPLSLKKLSRGPLADGNDVLARNGQGQRTEFSVPVGGEHGNLYSSITGAKSMAGRMVHPSPVSRGTITLQAISVSTSSWETCSAKADD